MHKRLTIVEVRSQNRNTMINVDVSPPWKAHNHSNLHWKMPKGISFRQVKVAHTPMTCFPSNKNRHWKNGLMARTLLREIQQYTDIAQVQLMQQVHGHRVAYVTQKSWNISADAMITRQKNLALATYTADCVPIMLTNAQQGHVAIIHAGWRGLFQEVIQSTCKALQKTSSSPIQAWIGPSICQSCYQVSQTFYANFTARHREAEKFFVVNGQHAYFDCAGYAKQQLACAGVMRIHTDTRCTYEHPHLPSHRQQGHSSSARLVSLIWRY